MALDENSPLDRATRAMRDRSAPSGWIELSGSIREAVTSSVRRGVDLPADPGVAGGDSTIMVADRVLRLALRDAVNGSARSLAGARVQLVDGRLSRLGLELVCPYGADLQTEAASARLLAREVLATTLGSAGSVAIDVTVVDIEE